MTVGDKEYQGANKYWTETLEENGAEIIGFYADTFRKGTGVISRNNYGRGRAYYLGTALASDLMKTLAQLIIADGKITQVPFPVLPGVEVIVREYAGRKVYCIFNFCQEAVEFELGGTYTDLLNDAAVANLKLDAKSYAFIMDN